MKVKTVRGFSIPEIGLGTYRMYGRECEKTVRNALDIEYRLIDTAQMYKNEKEIGDALYASSVAREEIFLTTKIWHTNQHGRASCRERGKSSEVEGSVKKRIAA